MSVESVELGSLHVDGISLTNHRPNCGCKGALSIPMYERAHGVELGEYLASTKYMYTTKEAPKKKFDFLSLLPILQFIARIQLCQTQRG